jgi:mycoredoxin
MNLRKEIRKIIYSVLASLAILVIYFAYIGPNIYQPIEGSKAVTIYTTAWCPYCKKLKKSLDKIDVSYTERDIEKSATAYFAFKSLGASGVPLSIIGEEVIYGYRPNVIQNALEELGYKEQVRGELTITP